MRINYFSQGHVTSKACNWSMILRSQILEPVDFPGGAVVKNLPANAGDTGLSPGPGRSHMPWDNKTCAP